MSNAADHLFTTDLYYRYIQRCRPFALTTCTTGVVRFSQPEDSATESLNDASGAFQILETIPNDELADDERRQDSAYFSKHDVSSKCKLNSFLLIYNSNIDILT